MSFYETVKNVYYDWWYSHPIILHGFIRALKPDIHVDCGTYRGLSAAWAAKAMQENNKGRVVCIDDFSLKEHVGRYGDPLAHLESNLQSCGVRDWIEIRQGNTHNENLWPERIDTAYIDAFHSYHAAKHDFEMAESRGATLIAFDDTENCVGPRMFCEEARITYSRVYDVMDVHSDNGLTIFMRKQPKRPVTFSQELPLPNPGVDLRPLSIVQQAEHFQQASLITGLDYSKIMTETEHDKVL